MAIGQISGDIVNDKRSLTSDAAFVIESHLNGKVVFNIAVNSKGEVTSTTVVEEETTIRSTPAKIKARNHVANFKFSPGTWYPKHHQARVAITLVQKK
ncbi:hypothetical protein CW751_12630 [Brumimicrobium salinarum]|uniref:TonB C-terminal domain-containing protein n=2 Tax=Brumimicrobium salinarum TaxID=2058658 RepID=A0A2I0R005_9FLAO|nr:hypothetical protein CW751_12630 [Brumimicrobium salinarum]